MAKRKHSGKPVKCKPLSAGVKSAWAYRENGGIEVFLEIGLPGGIGVYAAKVPARVLREWARRDSQEVSRDGE